MADKQFARSGTSDFDISVDDPLAELARIVGYEEKPPATQRDLEPARTPVAVRREPVFALEDELMQAFETYEAPRFDPVKTVSARLAESAPDIEPVADVEEPRFAAEPEAEPEELAYEELAEDFPEDVAVEAVEATAVPAVEAEPVEEAAFDVSADLEHELELSIGHAPEDDIAWEAYEASQAAVSAAEPEQAAERVQDEPVAQEDLYAALPAFEVSAGEEPLADEPVAVPAFVEPVEAAAQERVETRAAWSDIDELLEEVERFPVPPTKNNPVLEVAVPAAQPAEQARKINYPFTPTFGRATPVVSAAGGSSSAFATPIPQHTPRAIEQPAVETVANVQTGSVEPEYNAEDASFVSDGLPLETAVPDEQEPLDLQSAAEEPDFDLDNFELELSDIELDVDAGEFEMSSEEDFSEQPVVLAEQSVNRQPAAETVFDPHEFGAASEPAVVEPLPFDPTMITTTEEAVQTIAEMNVPQLPVAEKEQAYRSDYDLDIDAEIGQLFKDTAAVSDAVVVPAAAASANDYFPDPVWAAASQRVERKQSQDADALDDFERALEEDFRRSLSEPRQQRPVDDSADYADVATLPSDGRYDGRRWMPAGVIALGIVAVLALGGGVYAFMGSSETASSDGPQIILADKTPTKIVPEEKGGKTVPNQDKAVYDRVAGNQNVDPSQKALVSSVEEPVDVVQRTLTPEALPLEGANDDADAGASAFDSEAGERLLPNAENADTKLDEQKPGVAPRKVRTMVVKPDGTLVAREEIVTQPVTEDAKLPAETANATRGVEPLDTSVAVSEKPVTGTVAADKIAADKLAADKAAAQKTAETPVVAEAETELRPIEDTPAEATAKALAEAADTTVEGTAPVRAVKTTTISEKAPIPETRPVDQPVTVVGTVTDQGNVSNKVTTTPVADTEVATAAAETQQVAAVSPGGYVMQIASLPSAGDAQASYSNLSKKFGSVIGGRGVDIREANIPNKGTFYRVRIPAGSREEANALCTRYKKAGGSCLVTK
ncbi:SPOR domain-containing protein [Pararhizobium sp.]|uniref:SPOR domain-containing protein n=1 Tax=Pararhizobium sp. TaxID=1977563 RepID=UPI00271E2443|nr:SPOR domain-containing protein [Pararhizobium sp.]MDO9417069.1 SPOR domain-containing protein [Pararhizobium sp.]